MRDLDGFDEALATVLRRRALGERCPHSREVYPVLPTDDADAWTLRARALAAPAGARRDRVLALLAAGGWRGGVTQLRIDWREAA